MPEKSEPLRIANCSGFYGDRLAAAREMLEGGPIDYLTGDYLAELTMLILFKSQQKEATKGYATTFLRQMEDVLGLAMERGVRIVTDAGGLNPAGLAGELKALADKLGIKTSIAHIEGDNLLPKLPALRQAGEELRHLDTGRPLSELKAPPLTANAYLGAWGIVEALAHGANIVICPRVTDASVVVGPAAFHFGWSRTDWDRLAGAVVAGHVLECGAQATGGNYAFFREVPGLEHPGFPLAQMFADGSSIITKHPGTGGLVSVGTVTAQLLYEIDGHRYLNPDVVTRFDTIHLAQEGPDRVRISGVRGEPAPDRVKVCINYLGGFRNSMTFVLTGLDIEGKADLARRTLIKELGGADKFDSLDFDLVRSDKPDASTNPEASANLRVTAKGQDPKRVGRAFSNAVVEMVLANYPGFYCTTPPQEATPYGVYWPALVPADVPDYKVVLPDGKTIAIPPAPTSGGEVNPPDTAEMYVPRDAVGGTTKRVPLGTIFGARSGDKGGNANVGVWARSDRAYDWLNSFLTVDEFKVLVPESTELVVRRFEFPLLKALNFVVVGLLGEGVSSSTRPDAQAKSLGEYLRSRLVDLPEVLLADAPK
ncbi:MAG TPA: acyclic terpene utilization AtuA family protein [Pirellulales bacterium]|nr:acyclic terpene utilization AtuA family protein [Pirellulales bacterium]